MSIRPAKFEDLQAINNIYNQSVETGISTADMEPRKLSERMKWFNEHDPYLYPVFVYEKDNKVIGWIALSAYRKGRAALRHTAEVSYYIDKNYHNQGIGSALMKYIIDNAHVFDKKNLFAILLEHNTASIKLLEKFGFENWGKLPKVADFYGKEVGQLYFGLRIDQNG